ncbi:MAG: Plug domain-containing protein, partial [Muribaculaceae bacterium]|nr:Plug domain-containing protein [Muribaculaceae bacterium]
MAIQPIHSICVTEPDSVSESWRQLDELVIVSQAPRRLTDPSAESGAINIDARYMTDHPSLLGSNDAVALLKTLPAVATPNDLQAALSVHGLPPAYTHYESDGVRLINPLHMLGLYSTFNPEVYTGYRFVTSGAGALTPSTGGPLLSAYTADAPADALHGAMSAGILESHAALAIPVIRDRLSLRVGARQSYLNLLFPCV